MANKVAVLDQHINIEQASKSINPLEHFPECASYEKDDLSVTFYTKRKSDMDPKTLKWVFKLAEHNVGPYYKACSIGWQPKIKQSDLKKNWARFLVALDKKTKQPVAYSMFRFDLDYGTSVLYW